MSVSTKAQRILTWCGPAMLILWIVSFVGLTQFIPMPSPEKTPAEVVEMYAGHTDRVRLGLTITVYAAALLVPFAAVISCQIKRIEGPRGPLAGTQLVSAGLLSVEFIIPLMVWQAAIYRLEPESARLIQALNDMAWLMFVAVVASAIVQLLSIGYAILVDERVEPVFPRWAGYLNIWVAVILSPASLVVFFKHGAFAWNGLIAVYVPFAAYCVWMVVMFVLLRRAVDAESAEDPTLGMGGGRCPS